MFLAQGAPENLQSLEPVIVVLSIAAVLFWRVVLRILAIMIILLLVSGVVLLLEAMHHVIT
jgi:hypothetical protein